MTDDLIIGENYEFKRWKGKKIVTGKLLGFNRKEAAFHTINDLLCLCPLADIVGHVEPVRTIKGVMAVMDAESSVTIKVGVIAYIFKDIQSAVSSTFARDTIALKAIEFQFTKGEGL